MGIELVKPDFIVGSEKRFFEFIKGLNDKDKVALISHTDLDGISAARVVNEVVNADIVKLVNYIDFNLDLVRELKENKIKKAIITDICLEEYYEVLKELGKFAEILIIDHHRFTKDLNSEKIVFLVAQDYCASYLSYYLFFRTQDIEKLDWLVACASVADYCHIKPEAWLQNIFKKYGDEFKREGTYVRKSGKIWDLQWKLSLALIYFKEDLRRVYDSIGEEFGDIGDLEKYSVEVEVYLKECLERFEKEKIEINGGYFWEFEPKFKVASIVSTLVGSKYFDKTLIIGRDDGKYYSFSARRQDKKEDMNLFLKKLTTGLEDSEGGGHIAASGGHVLLRDKEEFKRRLGVK